MNERETTGAVQAVVLAAGKGTRMKSDLAKVLHPLAGRPLIAHVLDIVRGAGIRRAVVVVGHQAQRVREVCGDGAGLSFARQEPQLGTGHAVQVAAPLLADDAHTVILNGDVPLLRAATVRRLVERTVKTGAAAAVLTCTVDDAGAYGRIVRGPDGALQRVVEARDATPAERALREFNTGVFCFQTKALRAALGGLTADNDQHEYYLTDTIAWLTAAGQRVEAVPVDDPSEVVGINTVEELAEAERLLRARRA